MDEPEFLGRRATLDDLPALRPLWEAERLPVADLEKRVTEFQVAHTAGGTIVGAIGFKITGQSGLIHSEVFADFALADTLRGVLWERIKTLGRNFSLVRAWMRGSLPYWRGLGFDPADDATLEKLPPEFGTREEAWCAFKLRNDPFAEMSAAQEELLLKASLRADTERMLRQAKVVRVVAMLAAAFFFLLVCVGGWYLWRYRAGQNHGPGLRVVPWKQAP